MKSCAMAIAQISPKLCDKEYNLNIMEQRAVEARRRDVEFIIFPELTLTGYLCRDLFHQLAEPLDGESVRRVRNIAEQNGLTIIFGMPTQKDVKGVIYNSSVMVSEDGDVASYNKAYLPTHSVFDERRYFRPGVEINCFESRRCKVGLTICYDLYFPEIYRVLSLKGAEFIVCISASPSTRREYFELLTRARSIENGVFLIFANRVGIENGLHFWGGSHVSGPNGMILAKAPYYEEKLLEFTVDLEDLDRVRPFLPMLRDLRREIWEVQTSLLRNQHF
ncbi:MAG: carbon-nitrogen hydrolase family protein [Candidatus Bathyarchaeia archaeon]